MRDAPQQWYACPPHGPATGRARCPGGYGQSGTAATTRDWVVAPARRPRSSRLVSAALGTRRPRPSQYRSVAATA
eukprot:7381091-Lingulodinium_polyedra.AAC.1